VKIITKFHVGDKVKIKSYTLLQRENIVKDRSRWKPSSYASHQNKCFTIKTIQIEGDCVSYTLAEQFLEVFEDELYNDIAEKIRML